MLLRLISGIDSRPQSFENFGTFRPKVFENFGTFHPKAFENFGIFLFFSFVNWDFIARCHRDG